MRYLATMMGGLLLGWLAAAAAAEPDYAACRKALLDHELQPAEFPLAVVEQTFLEAMARQPAAKIAGLRASFRDLAALKGNARKAALGVLRDTYWAPDVLENLADRCGDAALKADAATVLAYWAAHPPKDQAAGLPRKMSVDDLRDLIELFEHLPPCALKVRMHVALVDCVISRDRVQMPQKEFQHLCDIAPIPPAAGVVDGAAHRAIVLAAVHYAPWQFSYGGKGDALYGGITPEEWQDADVRAELIKPVLTGHLVGTTLAALVRRLPADARPAWWLPFAKHEGFARGPMGLVRLASGDERALPAVEGYVNDPRCFDGTTPGGAATPEIAEVLLIPRFKAYADILGPLVVRRTYNENAIRSFYERILLQHQDVPQVVSELRAMADGRDAKQQAFAKALLAKFTPPTGK